MATLAQAASTNAPAAANAARAKLSPAEMFEQARVREISLSRLVMAFSGAVCVGIQREVAAGVLGIAADARKIVARGRCPELLGNHFDFRWPGRAGDNSVCHQHRARDRSPARL